MAGGALGSLARYMLSGWVQAKTGQLFPLGTLTVNLTGCFFIGLLWGFFEESDVVPHFRVFIFIGLLGGFTTFSSFGLESVNLLREGNWSAALLNLLANNAGGVLLTIAGLACARYLTLWFKQGL
ncbi:MAG: putative fluoride ion transporter CrcB [Cyclobacteriaceae bacterium]|nr:MAG: putative fluoride ion transporter CrcB [Cyclobacteriaceae bacterium]